MATMNRYSIPTPPDTDGESITLCDDCVNDHPLALELEHLNSCPSWHECAGANEDEGCPNADEDEDDTDED